MTTFSWHYSEFDNGGNRNILKFLSFVNIEYGNEISRKKFVE